MFDNLKQIKSFNWKQLSITAPRYYLGILTLLLFWGAAAFLVSLLRYVFGN